MLSSLSALMKLLDRYVIRESIAPMLLALAVFTFVFAINPMLDKASLLLAKNVPLHTVGYLLLLLLPQSLGITIPMAFLTGVLIALGRLSGDREAVALLACGVSPSRIVRPLMALAVLVAGADLYIMLKAIPDSNQRFREITFALLTQQSEQDIQPRIFFERFPNLVIYAHDLDPAGGWRGLMIADTSVPHRPPVTLAERGRLLIDQQARLVYLVLDGAEQIVPGSDEGRVYTWAKRDDLRIRIDPQVVFGTAEISRGLPEMRIPDLQRAIVEKRARGDSPHMEIIYLHQRFSFPVACFVFALLAVPLGLSTRKDGKLAGLTLGLLVVLIYYGLLMGTESWVKGEAWTRDTRFPPEWARWVPNIVLGLAGIAALYWRTRAVDGGLSLPLPGWLTRRRAVAADPDRLASEPAGSAQPARGLVVVIRVPRLSLPGPRLLDRYVGAKYLRLIGLAFVSLLSFFYIGTFIELSQKLFKDQATVGSLFQYLWYSTPQFIAFVLPIATLVAVLATMGGLARTGELTVMRACGVSLYRAALPLFALALVWSAVLFSLEDRVLAHTNRRAEVLENQIRGRDQRNYNLANSRWLAQLSTGRIFYFAHFDGTALRGLSVFETASSPYRLTGHTYADVASHREGGWIGERGWTQTFRSDEQIEREMFTSRDLPLPPIDFFEGAKVDPAMMTVAELNDYVREHGARGYNVAEQRVNLYRKTAFPAVTLVMTLLAVPFGAMTGRRGALYAIGLAIVLAFAYWLLTTVFVAIGTAGLLPAALAAWSANILFVAAAGYLTLTVRT
jgi:LPS export ABC transporter permease LptG/LPS export ABC transporter permease LptF